MPWFIGLKVGDDYDEWTRFEAPESPDAGEYDEVEGPFGTMEEARTEALLWYLMGAEGSEYPEAVVFD